MAKTGLRLYAAFAGRIDDGGFIESGYKGARSACDRFGIALEYVERIGVSAEDLAAAIEAGVATRPDLILAHGGSSDHAVAAVAPRHPSIRFLSTHGETSGENFCSFNIAQPQSAFLAGALAGWMTKSGVVGHLSGIRIAPGLRGRAAYAAGVLTANPQARLVTCFCGTQEDNTVTHRAAIAEIDAGVDIMYTMLNGGRQGAIAACRERGIAQIGNVRDWTVAEPDVFVASAVADTGRLVYRWLEDIVCGRLTRGEVRTLGMEDSEAVRLAMAPSVPVVVRGKIEALAQEVAARRLVPPLEYLGPELTLG
ncbi:MAG: BMP family protein [Burkholderiales bacterium]|nr:BMP family protein [Burkholderiales bacterium]